MKMQSFIIVNCSLESDNDKLNIKFLCQSSLFEYREHNCPLLYRT